MKKIIQLIFVVILLSTSILTSQVRKIVLLEEATNASCTPCAANNPTLQEFFESYYGGVISIRYHAWWPGNDPMYDLNTPDNDNRINYYGINGVPNYLIDGNNKGVPGSVGVMYNQMQERLALQSPVKIYIDASVTTDSVFGTVAIKAFDNVNQSNLRLRIAVIERMMVYGSPPGTNGEKVFPDVMRKMIPDGTGISIASISNGDSSNFYFSTQTNAQWNADDLSVVAFLQSDDTKEVIQSNIDHPTYIIETQDDLIEFVDQNQTYTKSCYIVNDNEENLNVRLKTKEAELPGDWTYNLVYNSTNYDSVDVNLSPGDTLYFGIVLNTGNDQSTGQSKLNIIAQNLSDTYNYGFSIRYSALQKIGDVLLVDADGGTSGQRRYATSIANAGYEYTLFDKSVITQMPDQILNLEYNSIFWANGWAFPAFELSDINFLKEFLDNGGSLFIAGQDIGYDIFEGSGSNFQEARDFYNTYMDATYVNDDSEVNFGEGIPGTLGEGIFFRINSISGGLYPEVIRSYSGMGDSLFFYMGTTKIGALAYKGATFKTVYLGIGLEQVAAASARDTLVARALRWFEQPVVKVDDEERILPDSFQLQQNFPNPFNPSTIIKYSVPKTEYVKIKVFDVTGSEVAVLVDKIRNPGNYQLEFDASLLSSGLYIYRLTAGEFTQSKKMLLMK